MNKPRKLFLNNANKPFNELKKSAPRWRNFLSTSWHSSLQFYWHLWVKVSCSFIISLKVCCSSSHVRSPYLVISDPLPALLASRYLVTADYRFCICYFVLWFYVISFLRNNSPRLSFFYFRFHFSPVPGEVAWTPRSMRGPARSRVVPWSTCFTPILDGVKVKPSRTGVKKRPSRIGSLFHTFNMFLKTFE